MDDPHPDLSAELSEGSRLAKLLVEHLLRMGAGACTLPVVVEDESYEVIVRHKPVKEEG